MKVLPTLKKSILFCSLLALGSVSYAGTLTPADADIVAAIHAKYSADNSVSAAKIAVTSHGGEVELTGKVDTDSEADKLIELAESVDHVKDVDAKNLKVLKSLHPLNDSEITAKVKGTFIREKLFGDKEIPVLSIKVETTNGVVYLTGDVDTKEEMVNAIKLAKSVKSVKQVKSKLQLKKVN